MVCRAVACDQCTNKCVTCHQKQGNPSPIVTLKFIHGMDFSRVLYLPKHFAQRVKHLADQEIQIEDSNGQRWSVALSYVGDSLAFKKGWHKFYLDHGLHDGHILLINYIKGCHFVVQIFKKCGCEKIKFNKGNPWQKKGRRRDPKTGSHDELFQTPDINFVDKPSSAKVASGLDFQNCQTHPVAGNVDFEKLQLPIPINMEELTCMINRDDGFSQGEDRNFLYDLSNFEMEKETPDANKFVEALDTKIPAYTQITEYANKFEKALDSKMTPCPTGTTEQSKTKEHDTQMAVINENQIDGHSGDIFTDKFEKALETNMVPSGTTEQSKTKEHDTRMAVINENRIDGHSGNIFTDELETASETNMDPSHADVKEQSKIKGDDTEMAVIDTNQINGKSGEIFTDKCEKVLDTKMVPPHADIKGQSKTKLGDTKMAVINTNQINGNSSDIFTIKFEKTCDTKAAPSRTEITEQSKTRGDDTQMAVHCSNQITGHDGDIFVDKFHIEPSANCNLSKGISNDVSSFQNDSEYPSIGSSKIAERGSVKRRFCEPSVSSSALKDPFGKRSIKREQVELGDKANCFPAVSRDAGKEPTIVGKCGQMFSPVVKVEPDLLLDTAVSSFSAEVKSQSYLELPVRIASIPGRKERRQGKVVYLIDSTGRLWPVLYPDKFSIKAFTANWRKFCHQNNIKPGDKCRFHQVQVENNMPCIYYRVDVTHGSGEFPG